MTKKLTAPRTISARQIGNGNYRVVITDNGKSSDYILSAQGPGCYTMDKLGTATEPSESYRCQTTGAGTCTCPAGQYHKVAVCRHVAGIRALAAAGKLTPPVVEPAKVQYAGIFTETDYCPL